MPARAWRGRARACVRGTGRKGRDSRRLTPPELCTPPSTGRAGRALGVAVPPHNKTYSETQIILLRSERKVAWRHPELGRHPEHPQSAAARAARSVNASLDDARASTRRHCKKRTCVELDSRSFTSIFTRAVIRAGIRIFWR